MMGWLRRFLTAFDQGMAEADARPVTYVEQPQPQGWDYHGNRATVAASRGEYYQVPRQGWTPHDERGHAMATSRGNAWVPGLGEVDPTTASVHYDGPGRDAWWYTSRGMQPPR